MKKLIFIIMSILLSSMVLATAPVIDTVTLTTTDPATNLTTENLTSSHTFHDDDGNDVTFVYNWYKDDVLNATTLIEDGLVAYWPMNDDADDYYGVEDCTLGGTPVATTIGKVDGGYVFQNGGADSLICGSSAVLDITGSLSFSMWIYPTSLDGTRLRIMYKYTTGETAPANVQYYLEIADTDEIISGYEYSTGLDVQLKTTTSPISSLNEWYHLVITREVGATTTLTLYVNGVEEKVLSGQVNPSGGEDSVLTIGSISTYGSFIGTQDEAMLYDRVLSADEVGQIYYGSKWQGNVTDSSRTTIGDTWILGVTGYDSTEIGSEKNSTGVLILSVPLPRIIASWWNAVTNILRATINEDGLLYLNGTMIIESITGTYSNDEAYLCVYNNGSIFSKDGACA